MSAVKCLLLLLLYYNFGKYDPHRFKPSVFSQASKLGVERASPAPGGGAGGAGGGGRRGGARGAERLQDVEGGAHRLAPPAHRHHAHGLLHQEGHGHTVH